MEFNAAHNLIKSLMAQHNVTCPLEISHGKHTLGYCKLRRTGTVYEVKSIAISRHLIELNGEQEVRNTILHELAHSLTPGHGHDWVWKMKAKEIGCDGQRLAGHEVKVVEVGHWKGICSLCNRVFYRHRGGYRIRQCTYRCPCGGKFQYIDTRKPQEQLAIAANNAPAMTETAMLETGWEPSKPNPNHPTQNYLFEGMGESE